MKDSSAAELEFAVTFEAVEGGVLASYVVKFPKESGLRSQAAALQHVDQAAAEAWIQDQARRRGIKVISTC